MCGICKGRVCNYKGRFFTTFWFQEIFWTHLSQISKIWIEPTGKIWIERTVRTDRCRPIGLFICKESTISAKETSWAFHALHKTELLYRKLAKSLKLAPFWCSYPLRQSPTGEVEKMIWSPTYRLNYQLVKRGRREFFRICTRRKIAKLCVWYQAVNFVDILCFPTPLQRWSRCFQLPIFS